MALPSTGPISMSQVRSELGLSGSISLGQSQVRELAGRPSGSISMSHLRGKSAVNWNASLSALPVSVFAVAPNEALAGIQIHSDGTIRQIVNNSNTTVGRWDNNDANTRSSTQVRFVANGDPLFVNGATSFVSATTTRTVSLSTTGGQGERLNTVRVELRNTNNTSQIVTRSVSLSAAVDDLGG